MKITRCPKTKAAETDLDQWEVLADRPVVKSHQWGEGVYTSWEGWSAYTNPPDPGWVEVLLDGGSADGGPEYSYMVTLRGREFGALLGMMRADAAAEAVRELLRTASPEVLGAIAGGIVSHVTAAALGSPGVQGRPATQDPAESGKGKGRGKRGGKRGR